MFDKDIDNQNNLNQSNINQSNVIKQFGTFNQSESGISQHSDISKQTDYFEQSNDFEQLNNLEISGSTADITDAEEHLTEEDDVSWYVIQTTSGKENVLVKFIETHIGTPIVAECFIPKRERRKKFNGNWKVITERLFPGYVFIIVKDPNQLFFKLKQIPMLSKLLGDGEYTFIPLTDNEIDFVSRIGNGRPDHTAKISKVEFLEGDEVVYIEGDLKSFEGQIKRFDKHKRQAIVETEMFGRKVEVYLGFEFLRKKET